MRVVLAGLLIFSALSATACSRKQHLRRDFGKSYDAAFSAQRAPPRAGAPTGPVAGLDSQEASTISDGYRASIAPKGVKTTEEPLILMTPSSRERPQQLAPSVPKER